MTDLSQDTGIQLCPFKELDSYLAGDDSNSIGIGGAEELAVDPLLLGGEVQVGNAWWSHGN